MKIFTALLSVAAISPLLACSSETLDGGSNTGASASRLACDNRSIESTCADFPSGLSRAEADASCDGALVEQLCPREGAVGLCTVTAAMGELTNVYYADGPQPRTAASAREVCETVHKGVFRAP